MNQLQMLLVAGLAAVASGASLFGLLWILRQRRRPKAGAPAPTATGPLPYRRVEALLTASERALYRVLRPIAETAGAELFVKVRLDDVVQVRRGAADYEAHCSRLAACGIDFLLCDRDKLVPLLAIQVEGLARERHSRDEDDRCLMQALDAVDIGFLRIPARASYDVEELGALVTEQLANAPLSATAAAAPAAGAGWDEVLGSVGQGVEGDGGAASPAQGAPSNPVPTWLDSPPPWHAQGPGTGERPLDAEAGEAEAWPAPLRDADPPPEPAEEELAQFSVPALQEGSPLPVEVPALREEAPPAVDVPTVHLDALSPDGAAAAEQSGEPATTDDPGHQPAEPPAAEGAAVAGQCPFCGRQLVPMQDVDSGEIVIACSGYPQCVYVAPLAP